MGGVVSVSGKNSVCTRRVKLAALALQQQEALANAQRNYNAVQDKMATAINKFVDAHWSLEDTTHEEKKEQHDPSTVTETMVSSMNEESSTAKEKNKKGNNNNKKKDASTTAEKAGSSTAQKEDDSVEQHPAETREKRFSDVKVQFEKVCMSGSTVCKLLDNTSGQVEIARHNNKFVRSLSSSLFTISKGVARSRSVKVGHCTEGPEHCSTLEELYAREISLEKLVAAVELEEKTGNSHHANVAKETVGDAFKRNIRQRNKKLEPLIRSLLKSLQESLKSMSKCHEIQSKIMSEKSLFAKPCEKDDARAATVNLQTELQFWSAAFTSYVCAQKTYIETLHEWSRRSLPPSCLEEGEKSEDSEKEEQADQIKKCTELLGDWLACLEKLEIEEVKEVSKAMSDFDKELKKLRKEQNKRQERKKKVDKLNEQILEVTKKKNNKKKREELDRLKENEKKAYETSMTNIQEIVTNEIRERFALIFKSLAEFTTKASQDYAAVASRNPNIEIAS